MAYKPSNPNGSATSANSEPVVIASDQAAVPVSGPLTDTQIRATALPISGTVTANAGTGTQNVSVQNASIPVTGTFFQATQPVSGTFWQTTQPISGTVTANAGTGAAPHDFGYVFVHKDGEYTTAQTGVALWTPTSGKKFVVSDITITTGGTTAGIVTLWQGASADTTYTVGTDPVIFRGEFAPSATSKPGAVKSFNVPFCSTTVDHILRVTTSAAMTVYIQLNGYEI